MRVVHILPGIAKEASGPSCSVPRLCGAIQSRGIDVTLAVLDWDEGVSSNGLVIRFRIGTGPRRLGRSPRLYRWLKNEVQRGRADVLHNHGMWQMNSVYPGWVAKRTSAKLVVSPRGAFSDWAMRYGSSFKKQFWKYIQRSSIESASCFHATAETEYHQIRKLGFRQPVAVIANGVEVPDHKEKKHCNDCATVLFLGRIHRVKGVEILLHAWARVMELNPKWRLVIAGTDEGYGFDEKGFLEEMKRLAAQLTLKRVEFRGAAYGEEKDKLYQEADVFVLASHSENFGMTVAEALAAGTPAIVSKGAPWSELETHEAGWWIDNNVDALAIALTNAMNLRPEDLQRRGRNGRDWMVREFSWDTVGERMHRTYQYLLGKETVPSWIRLD